ncbi:MAG: sulfite exporter TauE/SafE family protein [bacterium]|nr:sulfite exporter TauE/SafE family protein [bacterium]
MDLYALGLLIYGIFIGTVNTSTGIGWGVATVPFLFFFVPGLSPAQVVAVSLVGGIFSNGAATVENFRGDLIHWRTAAYLAAGAAAGGIIGSHIIRSLPAAPLRRILGVIVLILGARMVLGK